MSTPRVKFEDDLGDSDSDSEMKIISEDLVEKIKQPSFLGDQTIVTINVSDVKMRPQMFRVHKEFICHYSAAFKAAVDASTPVGDSGCVVLDLEETSPEVFAVFVNWLYTQEIVDRDGGVYFSSILMQLWLLADQILAPTLQNQVLRVLNDYSQAGKSFDSGVYHRVWAFTAEDSQLRRFIAEICSNERRWDIGHPQNYPRPLLVDIINAMRSQTLGSWSLSKDRLKDFFVSENIGVTAAEEGQNQIQSAQIMSDPNPPIKVTENAVEPGVRHKKRKTY